MVESKIRVLSVNSVISPRGERRIGVTLGLKCPIPDFSTDKKPQTTSITITPSKLMPLPQVPLENKAIFYFDEDDWRKLKNKPTVDDEYVLKFGDNGEIIFERNASN